MANELAAYEEPTTDTAQLESSEQHLKILQVFYGVVKWFPFVRMQEWRQVVLADDVQETPKKYCFPDDLGTHEDLSSDSQTLQVYRLGWIASWMTIFALQMDFVKRKPDVIKFAISDL